MSEIEEDKSKMITEPALEQDDLAISAEVEAQSAGLQTEDFVLIDPAGTDSEDGDSEDDGSGGGDSEDNSEEDSSEDDDSEDGSSEDDSSEEDNSEEDSSEEDCSEEDCSEEDSSEEDSSEEDSSEDDSSEDDSSEDDSSEDDSSEDGDSEDGDSEDGDSEDGEELELSGSDDFAMPLIQVVEAILFAADEALSIDKIAKAAGKRIRREAIADVIKELQECYQKTDRAFEIVEVAEKFQMFTRAEFAANIQALYGKRAIKEEKDKKISPAVLDTLAIVAYKQPVTRAEVEAVRGVGCGQVMRQLMERGSIRPVGKKMDVIGYPLLYGTTDFFLEEFGLASLEVLPMASELRRLTKVELPTPEVVEGQGEAVGEVESKLDGAIVIENDGSDNLGGDQEEEKADSVNNLDEADIENSSNTEVDDFEDDREGE